VDPHGSRPLARRELLADAGNRFLDSLLGGQLSPEAVAEAAMERTIPLVAPIVVGGVVSIEDEEVIVRSAAAWVVSQGVPESKCHFELLPEGLPKDPSGPVAVLIDAGIETEEAANAAGLRFIANSRLSQVCPARDSCDRPCGCLK
jgi:hypothetical protein